MESIAVWCSISEFSSAPSSTTSEKFVANAPAEVVAEERRRLAEADDLRRRIGEVLGRLA